jgi:hypothetical protein
MLKKEVRIVHISPLYQYVFGLPKHGFPEKRPGGSKLIPLTNGVAMVLHLLSIRYLRAWKIQLVGFNDFKQQPGDPSHISIAHEVEFDKRVLRSLDEAGYIELCD